MTIFNGQGSSTPITTTRPTVRALACGFSSSESFRDDGLVAKLSGQREAGAL